jgi:hypothetical protein
MIEVQFGMEDGPISVTSFRGSESSTSRSGPFKESQRDFYIVIVPWFGPANESVGPDSSNEHHGKTMATVKIFLHLLCLLGLLGREQADCF